MSNSIKVVLFDLGNVLVDLGSAEDINRMLAANGAETEAWKTWLQSPSVRAFDRGQISLEAFATKLIEEVGLTVSVEEFVRHFVYWPKGLFSGALALVQAVRPEIHRAILSNTNAAHWPRLMGEMGLAGQFHSYFASHQMGQVKPDRAVYESVLDSLGVAAESVLFIDDNQLNIDMAQSLGMLAFRVKGVDEARKVLATHQVLCEA